MNNTERTSSLKALSAFRERRIIQEESTGRTNKGREMTHGTK